MQNDNGTAADILDWMREHIAALMGTTADRIAVDAAVDDLGIDSAQSVNMLVDMEEWLGLPNEIPPDILFEGGTLTDIARDIAVEVQTARARL